jgi:hypothetical protein
MCYMKEGTHAAVMSTQDQLGLSFFLDHEKDVHWVRCPKMSSKRSVKIPRHAEKLGSFDCSSIRFRIGRDVDNCLRSRRIISSAFDRPSDVSLSVVE